MLLSRFNRFIVHRFNVSQGSPMVQCVRTRKTGQETSDDEPIKFSTSKGFQDWKTKYLWYPENKNDFRTNLGHYAFVTVWLGAIGTLLWAKFFAEPDNEPWIKPIWEIEPKLERPMLERFMVERAKSGLPVQHIRDRLKKMEEEGR
ncbi:uncharacterized protein LOC141858586 [Brevipalpus obovatus]|uniref:uncharacterized protein LOC141858586 n=1 Tax=Brevipalpus obovatus TaxID=246614 RepID=UPI003D9E58EF